MIPLCTQNNKTKSVLFQTKNLNPYMINTVKYQFKMRISRAYTKRL